MASNRRLSSLLLLALVASALLSSSGCGYFKNVGDDFRDIFILGAGVTPPVARVDDQLLVGGVFPPSIGAYVEITNFLHLGALYKVSGDFEWDRRGWGLVGDNTAKAGFLFAHYVRKYQEPIYVNDYKFEGNKLDPWRAHMRRLRDPIFQAPAKELIFRNLTEPNEYMYRGWQSWEVIQAELAIPEPFILHSGLNLRVGVDISEIFDFVLSLVGLDLYNDRAYALDGTVRNFGEARRVVVTPATAPVAEPGPLSPGAIYTPIR